jgi:hypothetical protein
MTAIESKNPQAVPHFEYGHRRRGQVSRETASGTDWSASNTSLRILSTVHCFLTSNNVVPWLSASRLHIPLRSRYPLLSGLCPALFTVEEPHLADFNPQQKDNNHRSHVGQANSVSIPLHSSQHALIVPQVLLSSTMTRYVTLQLLPQSREALY